MRTERGYCSSWPRRGVLVAGHDVLLARFAGGSPSRALPSVSARACIQHEESERALGHGSSVLGLTGERLLDLRGNDGHHMLLAVGLESLTHRSARGPPAAPNNTSVWTRTFSLISRYRWMARCGMRMIGLRGVRATARQRHVQAGVPHGATTQRGLEGSRWHPCVCLRTRPSGAAHAWLVTC